MKKSCGRCMKFYADHICNNSHFPGDEGNCAEFDSIFSGIYDHKKEQVKRVTTWDKTEAELKGLSESYHTLAEVLIDEYRAIPYTVTGNNRAKVKLIAQACYAARASFDALLALEWPRKQAEMEAEIKKLKEENRVLEKKNEQL